VLRAMPMINPLLAGLSLMVAQTATLGIAAIATAGVIVRPWRVPEAVWATAGAVLLVALGLVPMPSAIQGVAKGMDVYLFLTGMMMLAELARREGFFDWLAMIAVRQAHGSGHRLFLLIYAVGTLVTILLSNDATAVVLTPAVCAAARAAKAEPLPYLFICAFIANAASFVLPISNPANLVVFGPQMPSLAAWLLRFLLPSIASILITFLMLRVALRASIPGMIRTDLPQVSLSRGGRLAALGISVTALGLLAASALDRPLGLPTFLAGLATAALILIGNRESPWPLMKGVSWGVLPLVAGLFVLVEALERTGAVRALADLVATHAAHSPLGAAVGVGATIAIACNLANNLPVGLIAGSATSLVVLPSGVANAALIGVDIGPNLSITGSLATLLWLAALRREGQSVGALQFLELGAIVMPPALLGALALAIWPHV